MAQDQGFDFMAQGRAVVYLDHVGPRLIGPGLRMLFKCASALEMRACLHKNVWKWMRLLQNLGGLHRSVVHGRRSRPSMKSTNTRKEAGTNLYIDASCSNLRDQGYVPVAPGCSQGLVGRLDFLLRHNTRTGPERPRWFDIVKVSVAALAAAFRQAGDLATLFGWV